MLITNKTRWVVFCVLAYWGQGYAQTSGGLKGDVGMAVYQTPSITKSTNRSQTLLPYIYADYERLYARVDTFGYKLMPMGAGHLELSTRLSFEGYESELSGISHRARPKPYGIGTFQETTYGAFIFYLFHDAASNGQLLDASYAAELAFGDLHVYPQLGVERRDRKYVDRLYGVSLLETQRTGLSAYAGSASVSPSMAIAVEYPLVDKLKVTFQARKRWLDKSIYDSPLVNVKHQNSALIALSQAFE